jgi:dethiobiotin synthetase
MPAAEPKHPRGVFVTGTDTGVGKTQVSAALTRYLHARGVDVGVMKPVESGVADPGELGEDGRLLQWSARSDDPRDLISPYRLRQPLAPSLAARNEKVHIDFAHLKQTAALLSDKHDFLVIEGAGGLMTPLSGGLLVADLARDLGFPLLVVSRPGLGTINHTLLTIFAARAMEIPLAGFIINGMPQKPDEAEEAAPHTLASLASADLLGVLGHIPGDDHARVETLAAEIGALPTLPWLLMNLGLGELLA